MNSNEDVDRLQEQVWVLAAQTGNRDAFRHLVELHERRLLYFIMRIVNDSHLARDILQEVWLKVFRGLASLHAPETFRVWLYRIAHGEAARMVHRERRAAELQEALRNQQLRESQEREPALENAELVHRALQSLSVVQREVLTLRFLEDMALEEIANVVGCSLGTVKSRLHYATATMRIKVEELGHG